jgi:N utilization substance protein B
MTAKDPRHERRIETMQTLFAIMFSGEETQEQAELKYLPEAGKILQNSEALDQKIAQHAPERPLAEINQVDLAIMRLVVYEAETQNTPKKVLVDEAIELAKEFGTDSSPKFVNGVLGKVLKLEAAKKDQNE